MLSYLMGKPICYSSHNFVPIMTTNLMRMLQKYGDTLAKGMEHSAPAPVRRYYNIKIPAKPFLTEFDYLYRPSELEDFPLYFFFAGCEARPARGGRRPNDALDWYMLGNQRQYTARPDAHENRESHAKSRVFDSGQPTQGVYRLIWV